MRIAIIEDSSADAALLFSNIERYCQTNNVHMQVDQFETGYSFLSACKRFVYDLAFLDIFLEGDTRTGLEAASRLREYYPQCQFIFTTTSREHAIEAFRLHALDYLVKPYGYSDFEDSMKRFSNNFRQFEHYITLKEGRQQTRVLLKDILYTDYHNHYIQVHTSSNVIRSYMSFGEFAPLLEPYPEFLWCYRNCLVNINYIVTVDENDFVLENGERLPLSRMRKNEIIQEYADYVFEHVSRGKVL